jgi:predicted nucleic acid-binding protein
LILADTAIWIEYFRDRNPRMRELMNSGQISIHPFVIAELALGSLHDRANTLAQLDKLASGRVAHLSELRRMIEAHSLYSRGIGFTDAHLIASCLLTPGTQLWTRDIRLRTIAETLGIHADVV